MLLQVLVVKRIALLALLRFSCLSRQLLQERVLSSGKLILISDMLIILVTKIAGSGDLKYLAALRIIHRKHLLHIPIQKVLI